MFNIDPSKEQHQRKQTSWKPQKPNFGEGPVSSFERMSSRIGDAADIDSCSDVTGMTIDTSLESPLSEDAPIPRNIFCPQDQVDDEQNPTAQEDGDNLRNAVSSTATLGSVLEPPPNDNQDVASRVLVQHNHQENGHQVEDVDVEVIDKKDVSPYDVVINKPSREVAPGRERWWKLRGTRRKISRDKAKVLKDTFEVPFHVNGVLVQPRVLFRVDSTSPRRRATLDEIVTNVGSKRAKTETKMERPEETVPPASIAQPNVVDGAFRKFPKKSSSGLPFATKMDIQEEEIPIEATTTLRQVVDRYRAKLQTWERNQESSTVMDSMEFQIGLNFLVCWPHSNTMVSELSSNGNTMALCYFHQFCTATETAWEVLLKKYQHGVTNRKGNLKNPDDYQDGGSDDREKEFDDEDNNNRKRRGNGDNNGKTTRNGRVSTSKQPRTYGKTNNGNDQAVMDEHDADVDPDDMEEFTFHADGSVDTDQDSVDTSSSTDTDSNGHDDHGATDKIRRNPVQAEQTLESDRRDGPSGGAGIECTGNRTDSEMSSLTNDGMATSSKAITGNDTNDVGYQEHCERDQLLSTVGADLMTSIDRLTKKLGNVNISHRIDQESSNKRLRDLGKNETTEISTNSLRCSEVISTPLSQDDTRPKDSSDSDRMLLLGSRRTSTSATQPPTSEGGYHDIVAPSSTANDAKLGAMHPLKDPSSSILTARDLDRPISSQGSDRAQRLRQEVKQGHQQCLDNVNLLIRTLEEANRSVLEMRRNLEELLQGCVIDTTTPSTISDITTSSPSTSDRRTTASSKWLRCGISGKIVRDPVLLVVGDDQHLYDKEKLCESLLKNPFMHPATGVIHDTPLMYANSLLHREVMIEQGLKYEPYNDSEYTSFYLNGLTKNERVHEEVNKAKKQVSAEEVSLVSSSTQSTRATNPEEFTKVVQQG